ncbi:hypothetical protein AKJ08_3694 [Vulgatibacter incomptus]|uniref:Outer membrane protein beta-barrel domain-containing protein n=1 Tax=Vulgatibacter incomptus TaxID=1391653 RepID=A0A0K1PIH3_9BACT|nr:hypothetical protein AKJ08_3694 [Vulgatibacter incomptus]
MVAAAMACGLMLADSARADEEPTDRVSDEILSPGEAWAEPGFRIQLIVGSETLSGLNGVPSGGGLSLTAEPGVRLDRWWSLSATLHYTVLSGEAEGLRWSGTADLGFHPWSGLFVAAGLGYGGMIVNRDCTGTGLAASAKAGWLFPLGSLFATGPVVQTDLQWTRCTSDESSDRTSRALTPEGPMPPPPGGRGFVDVSAPSTWRHRSVYVAWSFAWR